MDNEVLLVKPIDEPIRFFYYNPAIQGKSVTPLESISYDGSPYTLVFQDPSTLQHVLINEYDLIKKTTKLRICIVYPLSGANLTSDEKDGGPGPNIAGLMAEWRDAFKAMPKDHQIKQIVFDTLCGQKISIKHVVGVLREEKVSLNEKAAGFLRCTVQGYNDDDAMWV